MNVQMRLDSLSEINDIRMRYLDNVKNILSGDIKPDSVAPLDSMVIKVTSDSLYNKSELEMAFVDNFEQEEKYNLSVIINNTTGKTFFTPVRGVLSQKYNKQDKNYGVSVLCAGNARISTPLDGVVFFCGYTLDYSYVVHIQHNNDYITVFKKIGNASGRERV